MTSCAGIVLTGGASRRMGRDKAALRVGAETLAERTARLLEKVAGPAVEVGPGRTRLPAVRESPPGSGPLAAAAAGWKELGSSGWRGPVILLATDLPRLTEEFLVWLAEHPSRRSVIPCSGGRLQPLCARYRAEDLDLAARLAAEGARAMRDLLAVMDAEIVKGCWDGLLDDIDTPDDMVRMSR